MPPEPPPVPDPQDAAPAAVVIAVPASIQVRAQANDGVQASLQFQVAVGSPAEAASPLPSGSPNAEVTFCGHRSIGNKSCRRPAGHAEKNHRYK